MKITAIRTFLMQCAPPQAGGWSARNWLFVKVETDAGIHGWDEGSLVNQTRTIAQCVHHLAEGTSSATTPAPLNSAGR